MESLLDGIEHENQGRSHLARPIYQRIIDEGIEDAALIEALVRLGVIKQDDQQHADAVPLYERALALAEAKLPPVHPLRARAHHELGTYLVNSDLPRATALIERSEELWRASGSPDEIRRELGRAWLHEKTKPDDVLDHFRRAAEIAERTLPIGHRDQREALRLLGEALWARGQKEEAVTAYERKLALFDRALEHPFTAMAIADVAYVHRNVGEGREGRAIFGRYLERMRAELPGHSSRLLLLGWWRAYLRDENEALDLKIAAAEEELEARGASGSPLDAERASLLFVLRHLYLETKDRTRLEAFAARLEKLAETARAALPPESDPLGQCVRALALTYKELERGAEQLAVHHALIAHREQRLGADHPSVATAIQSMADDIAYENAEVMEPLVRRAVGIRERALGPTHDLLVQSLTTLAMIYAKLNNPEAALKVHQRRVAAWREGLSPERPKVAWVGLEDVANAESGRGNVAAAMAVWDEALKLVEERLGKEHEAVASILCGMANHLRWTPRVAEIKPLFERAAEIRRRLEGESGPGVAEVLGHLAEALQYPIKDLDGAVALRRQLVDIHARNSDRTGYSFALQLLAQTLEAKEAWADAVATWQQIIAYHEGVHSERYNLAAALDALSQLHLRRGERDAALLAGDRAASVYQQIDSNSVAASLALERLGAALLEVNLAPEAEERLALALPALEREYGERNDATLRATQRYAEALAKQDRVDEAAESWARIVANETRSDGEDARVRLLLARYHAGLGRREVARDLLGPAIQRLDERSWDDKWKALATECRELLATL